MTTRFHRQSAKIYQFPIGMRTAPDVHRKENEGVAELKMSQFSDAAFGSGWYHEAAIQEAEQSRKN
jgi:hypothetical protein